MKNLNNTVIKRVICVLLAVAMLCANTEVAVYATEETEQKVVEETSTGGIQAEEVSTEEPSVENGQNEEASSGEMLAEDGQTEELPEENDQAEGEAAKDEEPEENSPNKAPVKEENTNEENAETNITEGNPVSEDSASENDLENKKDNIASGEYKENGNDITWTIDADGNLTVEGTGDFADPQYSDCDRAPWYGKTEFIKHAQVNVTNMTNASYMFYDCSNLISLDVSGFDTSKVTDMTYMFYDCYSLSSLDLSSFDTSHATNMSRMFYMEIGNDYDDDYLYSNLTSLDLSDFNTSNVTDMSEMFYGCMNLTSLNVHSFDTSQVTDMSYMFYDCCSLSSLDLSSFDTSQVTDMTDMLYECTNLVLIHTPYNLKCQASLPIMEDENITFIWYDAAGNEYMGLPQNINYSLLLVGKIIIASGEYKENGNDITWTIESDGKLTVTGTGDFADPQREYDSAPAPWHEEAESIKNAQVNVTNMTNASYMFAGCRNLVSLDVSGFDTSKVTDMSYMFYGCYSLSSLDLSSFDTSQVTNMAGMFSNCSNLTSVDVSGFDTCKVTDMGTMFDACKNLMSLNVSSFNTSEVTSMYAMFRQCFKLTSVDVSGFDTSNVGTMDDMFRECINLMSLDVSGFDTSNVEIMSGMFYKCISLVSLDVSGFDTSQAIDMGWMFCRCISLTSLDVSGFDTSQVTDMGYMFKDCISLTSLDTSGFTGNISEMYGMFRDCSNLTSLDLSGLAVSKEARTDDVFTGCKSLTTIHTPLNLAQSITLPGESTDKWYQMDGTEITELPTYLNYSIVVGKNEKPIIKSAIIVTKKKTNYGIGDHVNIDDLTITYYDADGISTKITEGYSTNVNGIDMSTLGTKRLRITYNGLTTTVMLNVKSGFNGSFGDITWTIDVNGKLTVNGTGNFSNDNNHERAPWYDYADAIISAEVNVTDMTNASYMFNGCKYITSISLAGFNTSKVTNMGGMFYGCESLRSLDLSNFDTSQVTNMYEMFYHCENLKSLDLSSFDTSQVTDMADMFYHCENLKSLNVSSFDTSQVTYMREMFYNCRSLENLGVNGFDTNQVRNMAGMFSECSSLTNLDVSGFNTSKVTDMADMFSGCSSLTSLDVTGFDTNNVIYEEYGGSNGMDGMFSSCSSLANLDISNFNMSKLDSVSYMFVGCTNLATICTPCNLKCPVSLLVSRNTKDIWYDEFGNKYTKLPLDSSILIRRNKIPACHEIEAKKVKTDYICGDTVYIDDLTVLYYDGNGIANVLGSGEYTTNINQIDMSTEGDKSLIVTYHDGGDVLTYTIKLMVKRYILELDTLDTDNVMITLSNTSDYVYDGNPKTPEVTVVYMINSESISENSVSGRYITLEKEKDYTVTYENNINAFEDSENLQTAQNAPRVIITGNNKYSGTVSKTFAIQKAEAPKEEEQAILIQDSDTAQEGRTLDISGCFADYDGKTGYTVDIPVEDDIITDNVLSGNVSVDEKGILTYSTNVGKAGDFVVIPVIVSFANYRDAVLNVKIIFDQIHSGGLTVTMPVANPESGRQLTAGSKITLTCETPRAEIYYTAGSNEKALTDPTGTDIHYTEPITVNEDMYIKAVAIKGDNRSKTVTLHYTVTDAVDKVLKPYAVPGQGAVEEGTNVELKSDTPDAVIYYVTGQNANMLGAVPVDDAYKYTEPIEITGNVAVKAIALKEGMENSDFSTFVYKIKVTLDPPTADPVSETIDRGSYISLNADSDTNIYYTVDQSNPITSGSAEYYENKIRVDGVPGSVIVIKAVAEKNGTYSEIVTFTYTISENTVKGLQVMLAGSEEFTYTGSAITPAVIVTNNGVELTEGEDYTVRYSNNIKAADKEAKKAPKITVTGKGNLTKSRSVTFSIKPMNIGDEEILGGNIVVAEGKTASPILYYGNIKLTAKDYVNPNAKKKYDQDETITITGKGNFEGTRDIDVKVVNKKDMKKFTVAIDNKALKKEPLIYDGEEKTLDGYFEVFDTADKTSPLEEYSDYVVIYPKNNINAGKVKFTVIGLGEYYGAVTKSYTIQPKSVKTEEDGSMEVNVDDGDTYPFKNGGVVISDLTVTCDGDILILGKDYKVAYSSNKNICTNNKAKCTISFKGNYKGSKPLVRRFNISPAVMDDVDQINGSVSVALGDKIYTGKPGTYKSTPYVTVNGVLLKSSDYKVSYYKDPGREQVVDGKIASSLVNLADNDKQQTVYVKIEGKKNYEGTLTAEYNVYRLTEDVIDLAKAKVNFVGGKRAEYTGESIEPEIEIMYKSGREWKKVDDNDIGTYVTVTYINNVNKGKATVMINGNGGKYAGSKTAVFNIVPKSMK